MGTPRVLACFIAVSTSAAPALGAEGDAVDAPPSADSIDAHPKDEALWSTVERPWLYQADPSAPPAGHVIAGLSVGYAAVDRGAARPFAADLARAGAVYSATAEVGVHRLVALHGEGLLAGQGTSSSVSGGAMLGVTAYPLPQGAPVDASVSAGYLRELGGSSGAWGRIAVAGDVGPARLVLTALGEHVFEPGRDGVDVLVTTGVSYALADAVRVGAEYVVQDLEGAWDPEEADGGIRHFVGPNVALELMRHRARLVAGPAFGLSEGSPRFLGRVAALYSF
jgi:hypothetical protein